MKKYLFIFYFIRLVKIDFQVETTEPLQNYSRIWLMLSCSHTTNWGALEQVIYPLINPVEDCVSSWNIRGISMCSNELEEKQKGRNEGR